MVIRTLYYVYMSLYASSNAVTGLYMIGDFVYMSIADMRNLANLVTGIIALSIGIACFVGLYVRRATDNKTLLVRKRLKELLAYVLLPLLVILLIINAIITPLLSLYIATIVSIAFALLTFLFVNRRLHTVYSTKE